MKQLCRRAPLFLTFFVVLPCVCGTLSSCAEATPSVSMRKAPARGIAAPKIPVGARIAAAARRQIGTRYTQEYFSLRYPSGDPPREVGACTDVIIRALRPSGYDLQRLIHEDMARNFRLYPRKWGLRRTDKNIDHRRVPNQRVFFSRFAKALTQRVTPQTLSQWQPGDFVFWKLSGEIDHCGVISDRRAPDGTPFVIHNLGGCREENALNAWKIVGHFRFPKH